MLVAGKINALSASCIPFRRRINDKKRIKRNVPVLRFSTWVLGKGFNSTYTQYFLDLVIGQLCLIAGLNSKKPAFDLIQRTQAQKCSSCRHCTGRKFLLRRCVPLASVCRDDQQKIPGAEPVFDRQDNQGIMTSFTGSQSSSNGNTVVYFCCFSAKLVLTVRTTPIFTYFGFRPPLHLRFESI